jgi:ParB family chromosome partitioning protein
MPKNPFTQSSSVSVSWLFDPGKLELPDEHHDLYDPRQAAPMDEALVLNIMAFGVLEPVVVRLDDGQATVVDGRRRVQAAREANKRLSAQGLDPIQVQCVRYRGSDATGAMITCNEMRLDDTPLARARKCERYLATGRSEEQAALAFGVGVPCVRSWLALLDAPKCVRDAVDAGKLSASAAKHMIGMSASDAENALQAFTSTNAELASDEYWIVPSGALAGREASANKPKKVTARDVAKANGEPQAKVRSMREIRKAMRDLIDPSVNLAHGWKGSETYETLRWVIGEAEVLP